MDESNLRAKNLGDFMSEDVYREAHQTAGIEIPEAQRSELGNDLAELQRPGKKSRFAVSRRRSGSRK